MSEQLSNRSWFRRNWKLVVNLVTLLALIILVYAIRHQVGSTLDNLKHLKIWALLLLIPIEVLNYHAQAKIYQRLFEIVGNRLSYRFLFGAALELNFVNHVFPSSGKATLVHVMKLTLYVVAFEIILIFGMLALALMGRVNDFVVLVAGSLSTLLVVSTLVFIYIVGSKERIDNFFTSITKLLNRLIKIVRPKYPETINIEMARGLFSDFHDNYQDIKNNFGKLKSPFWYSLLADMTEIAAIYTVYVAFGKLINVGAVVLAYGIANFAGLISVMPGGVGIYEALMTAVLASTGVPPGLSLPVTITYRIFNTLIQLPPGYYLYNRTIRRRSPSIEAKQIQ
jgi:uncharacterized protein (TIRG00374 family)